MEQFPSVIEVFVQWVTEYMRNGGVGVPQLVSGAPEVGPGVYISDVDVSIVVHPDKLEELFKKYGDMAVNRLAKGYFTVSFDSFKRPVNVRFTTDVTQVARTMRHRVNELALTELYPALAHEVKLLKVSKTGKGMGTEAAWVHVLGLDGLCVPGTFEDPYGVMDSPVTMLIDAAKKVGR